MCLDCEEGKDSVLPDRTADTAAQLIEALIISQIIFWTRHGTGPVVTLVSVQAGAVKRKEEAAMNIIGAALRRDQSLRTTEAAIFSVVIVGDDSDIADRILSWSNDGGSTPHRADRTDSVDRDAVRLVLPAVGVRLNTIFRWNAGRA